jgi:hypothetical protein
VLSGAAYGLELDPAYIDVTIRRYESYTGKTAVLADTGQTFAEVAAARGISLHDEVQANPDSTTVAGCDATAAASIREHDGVTQ